ncbi:MAG TPA: hypothetical protein VMT90_03775 [Dehalococcoidia bacterium]|jgi:hypothetical protein|nr:hypothetical protein [Dehalococcoidia bacterium]
MKERNNGRLRRVRLGLDRAVLRQALRAKLVVPLLDGEERSPVEHAQMIVDALTDAIALNNTTVRRQLEQAGLLPGPGNGAGK